MSIARVLVTLLGAGLLAAPTAIRAQEDRPAGLFTKARQLPLVSQSISLQIAGGEAELRLVQLFFNDGEEVGQADYQLYLPEGASVRGFGFWNDEEFLAARLREKKEAEARHQAAAGEGRATSIMKKESNIHSFSVYPVAAGEQKKVEVRLSIPIERELGRYRVRIPVDEFLGSPAPSTSVLIELRSEERVVDLGVTAGTPQWIRRDETSRQLILSLREDAELWWTEEGPPLLLRAEAVALGDGDLGLRVRAALNDGGEWREPIERLELVIDASYSMRRRTAALRRFLDRVSRGATVDVRFHTVAEEAAEWTSVEEVVAAVVAGKVGHRLHGDRLAGEIERLGCSAAVRCSVVGDPQMEGIAEFRETGVQVVLLSDVHERAYFDGELPSEASVCLPGVDPDACLLALADELVRPVLEIDALLQDGDEIALPGRQSRRVAEGGVLRLYGRVGARSDVEVRGTIDGESFIELLPVELLDDSAPGALIVRRGVFREVLAGWMDRYRREPDAELKRQIVETSVREGIPTAFTALQVDDPRLAGAGLPRTATSSGALLLVGSLAITAAGLLLLFPTAVRRRAG
jgi:hypothetical protein